MRVRSCSRLIFIKRAAWLWFPLLRSSASVSSARSRSQIDSVDGGVAAALERYEWPGNVRELENTIERAVVLTTGSVINASAISLVGATSSSSSGLPSMRLHQNLEWVERETIRRALEQSGGVKKDAAELMGISQRALSYYLAKYRID